MSGSGVRAKTQVPTGFMLALDFLNQDEEAAVVSRFDQLAWTARKFRGREVRRSELGRDVAWDFERQRLLPASTVEHEIAELRRRVVLFLADLGAIGADTDLQSIQYSRYQQGGRMPAHVDRPCFGPVVAAVSLLGPATMVLRSNGVRHRELIAPRSLYVLTGPARYDWTHEILPVKSLRYAVTLRTVVDPIEERSR